MAATDTTKIDVSDIPANRPESQELATCIVNATKALEQKFEILATIQSSRLLSTLLIENGSGSRAQVEWVRTYLPRKKRRVNGDEDED